MDEIKITKDAQEALNMCPTLDFEEWAPAWMLDKDGIYKEDEELKGKLKVIWDKVKTIDAVRRGIWSKMKLIARESYGFNASNDIVVELHCPLSVSMNMLLSIATQIGARDATIDAKGSCRYSIIFEMK